MIGFNKNKSFFIAKNELILMCRIIYDLEYKVLFEKTIQLYKDTFNNHIQKLENKFVQDVLQSLSKKCKTFLNIYLSEKGISLTIRNQLSIIIKSDIILCR